MPINRHCTTTHSVGLGSILLLSLLLAACGKHPPPSDPSNTAHALNGSASKTESETDCPNRDPTRPCCKTGSTSAKTFLTLGVYQTDKPTVMYNKFKPMTVGLSGVLSESLGRPVGVELVILPTYEKGLEAIVNGNVDFARLGPASYIMARERNPQIQLLAMELVKGAKRFKGVIVVRADSRFKTLNDLKGASFAFGNSNSTIGRFLAQARLVEAGVFAKDLARYEYLGRHDKVARAVEIGDFDAGSLKINTYKKVNKDGKLRILVEFDNVTKPWVARDSLSTELFDALRTALLEWEDKDTLKALKASGFAEASDGEYAFVRDGMTQAATFGE